MRLWKLGVVAVLSVTALMGCGGGSSGALNTKSQDEGRIYFESNVTVVQAKPDGSAQKTVAQYNSRQAKVRRDGKKITYVSKREGSLAVYVADANGANDRRLIFARGSQVPIGGDVANPSFSPDGKQIVYEGVSSASDEKGLFLIDADGGPQRQIPGTQVVLQPYNPVFTPDGRNIIFKGFSPVSQRGGTFIVEINGGAPARIFLPNAYDIEFSRDGRQIVFLEEASFPNSSLYIADSATPTRKKLLADGSIVGGNPTFSPDGEKLLLQTFDEATQTATLSVFDIASKKVEKSFTLPAGSLSDNLAWGPTP